MLRPFRLDWKAPGVTGRSVEEVLPAIQMLPEESSAIALPVSFPPPPKYVENTSVLPSGLMAQQVISAERIEEIDEQDAIRGVLQLYIDGSAKGDVAKLKEAFHPDSRMFGSLAGQRIDIPIQVFFQLAAKGPADTAGRYRARIVNVTRVGDAAVAEVVEDGFWGSVSFVDFFSLTKIDGRWWIVNKTFAHTGGEPPAF